MGYNVLFHIESACGLLSYRSRMDELVQDLGVVIMVDRGEKRMGSANTGLFVLVSVGGTLASCSAEVGNCGRGGGRGGGGRGVPGCSVGGEPRVRCA